jgi:tetratricopeptide (TPR) repeat protein
MDKMRCFGLGIVLFFFIGLQSPSQAGTKPVEGTQLEAMHSYEQLRASDPEYNEAMKLFLEHRHFDAQPKLEKLLERYPSDPAILDRLGVTLILTDISIKDAGGRKAQRARARKLLVKARELGLKDNLNEYYVSVIPEDGGEDMVFSNNKEANDAMNQGEAAFARGDFKAAIAAYTKAMMLQPNLYHAVLFIGDSYFGDKQYIPATEWFERATKVDQNVETAYRYWGDALMKLGRMDEARLKFLEAIVAEPYNKNTWVGLQQWAEWNQIPLSIPDVNAPKRTEPLSRKPGDTTIYLDSTILKEQDSKDGTGAWVMYQIMAGAWQAKLFKEKFPEEKQYRHTLAEEKQLLMIVAESVGKDIEKGALKPETLDPGIALLLKLHKADMLEPYILIARADKGLAKDYPAYREANRDKLRQFLDDFVARKNLKQN